MNITQIHSLLSKKELKKFGDFIRSPYFNTEPRFIKVYEIIATERDNLSRDLIAKKIFGSDSSAGDVRFRKLVSEFMKLFESFLCELEFKNDDYRQRLMLVKQLSTRNLKNCYLREAKRIEESVQIGGIKDEEYYLKMLELYSIRYQIEGFNSSSWKDDFSFKIDDYIEKYFVCMKLFLYQRHQSIEYIFKPKNKIENKYLAEICDYVSSNSKELSSEYSDIFLRYKMYNMIETPEKKELLEEYLSILSQYEENPNNICRVYYEDLINYYTLLVNSGKKEFENNIIHIARIMDNRNYFKEYITPNEYKIIIEAAIGIKEYVWAEQFAEKNKNYITDRYQHSIYSICMAKINFFKKDFSNVRNYIAHVAYDDFMYYSEAKLIECRILYEEENISELFMIIETMKKYLKTHKEIGLHHKESYLFFLNILKKLTSIYEAKLTSVDVNYEIKKLEDEINSSKNLLYGIKWLKDSLEILK